MGDGGQGTGDGGWAGLELTDTLTVAVVVLSCIHFFLGVGV